MCSYIYSRAQSPLSACPEVGYLGHIAFLLLTPSPSAFMDFIFLPSLFFPFLIFLQRVQNHSVVVPTLSVRCTIDAADQSSVDGWHSSLQLRTAGWAQKAPAHPQTSWPPLVEHQWTQELNWSIHPEIPLVHSLLSSSMRGTFGISKLIFYFQLSHWHYCMQASTAEKPLKWMFC